MFYTGLKTLSIILNRYWYPHSNYSMLLYIISFIFQPLTWSWHNNASVDWFGKNVKTFSYTNQAFQALYWSGTSLIRGFHICNIQWTTSDSPVGLVFAQRICTLCVCESVCTVCLRMYVHIHVYLGSWQAKKALNLFPLSPPLSF